MMEHFNKTFLSAAQSKPVRVFEIGIQFHVPSKEHFERKTILGNQNSRASIILKVCIRLQRCNISINLNRFGVKCNSNLGQTNKVHLVFSSHNYRNFGILVNL